MEGWPVKGGHFNVDDVPKFLSAPADLDTEKGRSIS
jgi:hypothetical protein